MTKKSKKSTAAPAATSEAIDAVNYYQQGDVLLKRIAALPTDLELTKAKDLILQYGESTGHRHLLRVETERDAEVLDIKDGQLLNGGDTIMPGAGKFVIVNNEVLLTHEEHKTISIAPGIYQMDLVREYDYDKEEMRRVID